jgi:hypothetical protein
MQERTAYRRLAQIVRHAATGQRSGRYRRPLAQITPLHYYCPESLQLTSPLNTIKVEYQVLRIVEPHSLLWIENLNLKKNLCKCQLRASTWSRIGPYAHCFHKSVRWLLTRIGSSPMLQRHVVLPKCSLCVTKSTEILLSFVKPTPFQASTQAAYCLRYVHVP